MPARPASTGWRLLSEAGVDVSLLAEVASRNRRPLLSQDGDAFYAMLAAAGDLPQRQDVPVAETIPSVKLLAEPENLSGQWLRIELETVQVTRIAVTEPRRQTQLGSDHYFQLDAMADLGNVIVKLQRPPGQDGPPAIFDSRYPVSVVTRQLPPFLVQRIRQREGGSAVVSQIRMKVQADAFFFRLWSYETDFMSQYGSGEQFGPLLIAARIRNLEPTTADPAGVRVIGAIAAVAVIAAIVATWLWNRRLSAEDRQVREKRKARESQQLHLP
jgi:hypothetical protein